MRNAAYNDIYETGNIEAIKTLAFTRMEPISRFLGDERPFIVGDYVTFADFFLYE